MTRAHQPDPTPPAAAAEPSPFDRFQALARRILTTPKSEIAKEPAPATAMAKQVKGKGRRK